MSLLLFDALSEKDIEPVLQMWRRAFAGRPHDFQVDAESFYKKVWNNPAFDPGGALIGRDGDEITGFALVLPSQETQAGFLSVLLVDPARQGSGTGSALLTQAGAFLIRRGIKEVRIGYRGNPASFAIGVDVATPAYAFFLNRGFRSGGSPSLIMEKDLTGFALSGEVSGWISENEARGIRFGLCEVTHRDALLRFMADIFPGGWEASVKRALEEPSPYPVLVATDGVKVVGFSGPIRVQPDGKAGFTGIGTQPDYRRRKIGAVLFNLLCAEFKKRGATHSTLHTGLRNPAQEIYFGAGYRVRQVVDYTLVRSLI